MLAPVLFILLQALQYHLAHFPAEATGILAAFSSASGSGSCTRPSGSPWASLVSFTLGRWLGAHYVKNSQGGDLAEARLHRGAEGAIVCFITS